MTGQFKDMNVLVAGASRGIGEGIALAFAREGGRVFIGGRTRETLEAASTRITTDSGKAVEIVVGDFASTGSEALVVGLPPLDVLVVNYGGTDTTPGFDTDDTAWDRLLNANLTGPARLSRHVARAMALRGSGAVVFIGSICGHEVLGAPIAYNVAKAGLRALTKTMATELGPKNVRVNLVDPGNIFFEGGRWAEKHAKNPVGVDKMIVESVPLGRFGTPADIADAVLFMCSKRAAFITGANLVVDGGQIAGF